MSPERSGSPLALEPRELALALQSAVPPFQLVRLQLSQTMQTPSSQSSIAQNTPTQQSPQQDDDLTSLTWLQDNNLLKGMNLTCVKTESDGINTKQMDIASTNLNNNQMSVLKTNSNFADQSPTSDYMDESSVSEPTDSSSSSLNSPIPYTQSSKSNAKHPHNMRYDPMVHTFSKPPYSFSCLIFMAIEDSPAKALPVKDIYAWILDHFPYFKNAPTGWKNSVRHNLSLNKCFQKVEKSPNLGKGSLWMVDQQYRPNLLQALTRSPFHPCSTLDPSTFRSSSTRTSSPFVQQIIDSTKPSTRLPNPELFPYLSRRLAASEGNYDMKIGALRSEDESSLDDVDAATAILALKHGSRVINIEEKKRRISTRSLNTCIIPSELVQVITRSPSEDHTYSVADNIELQDQRSSSPDEAFESDDSHSRSNFSSLDLEEQRRIEEGADALLNLAGITTLPKKTSNDIFSYAVPSKRKRCHDQNTSLCVMEQSSISVKSSDQNFSPRMLRAKRKPDGLLHNHLKRKNVINNNNNNNNFDKRSHKTVTSKNEIRIYEKNIRFTQR